jgi:hypothetical protein
MTIKHIRNKRKKKQQDFQKRKNLATTNYSDQSASVTNNTASVSSSITGLTGGTSPASAGTGRGHGKLVIFMYNVQVLQTNTKHPTLPVPIHSVMPHIMLQLGPNLNNSKSSII